MVIVSSGSITIQALISFATAASVVLHGALPRGRAEALPGRPIPGGREACDDELTAGKFHVSHDLLPILVVGETPAQALVVAARWIARRIRT